MSAEPAREADRAIARLAGLGPLAGLGLRFCVLAPRGDGAVRSHVVSLSAQAGSDIAAIAERSRARVQGATQLSYGPAVLIPPGHCMHIPQSAAATLAAIQADVDRDDAELFDETADYVANASMLAARFTDGDGAAATFYRVRETLLQLRKGRVTGLIYRDGRYDRLEPGDVLLMRSEFDVVVVEGMAFFFAKSRFEQAFGFVDELRRSSAETFDAVTARLRIKGIGELRAACTSQPQMMAKMASIRRSMSDDVDYARAMTMARLTKFVAAHPHLGIQVEGRGHSAALVFDPAPANRFKILSLLDDDFLRSVLTERDYEAGSKVRQQGDGAR